MKCFLVILYLIFQHILFSQNLIFKTLLIDSNSLESIPYATLSFSNSLLASTSNDNGEIYFAIPKAALPDTLLLRHISFENKKVFISLENFNNLDTILLSSKENLLHQTIIYAKTAKQIVQKSIDNIKDNYYTGTFILDGFYRQSHQENNNYVRLIECFAIVKEDIFNRASENQKETFIINEIRRSNVYEQNGDKHGDHLVDLFSENPITYASKSFLNSKDIHTYNFSFSESNSTAYFKIVFQNKNWASLKNKSGYMLINKDDFAIVEMQIISSKNSLNKNKSKSNWKFQNGTYTIAFKKKNGKYYCKKASKYYNHFVLNENTNTVDYIVEEYFDWYSFSFSNQPITSYILENYKVKKAIPFKTFSNLYSIEYNYDSSFWNSSKIPDIKSKIIEDLNKKVDLEKQFIND